VLHLAQALSARSESLACRLWIVTRHAVRLADEEIDVAQAPLWGLGRSLASEIGRSWGGLIDAWSAGDASDLSEELTRILSDGPAGGQVALRSGWYVPRLVRVPAHPPEFGIDADGAYLVSGGLGGLGLTVARWLAGRGVRHLILVGRRGLPPREQWAQLEAPELAPAIRTVCDLESQGVSVRIEAADVGSAADVARITASLSDGGVPLRGIVHAAGVPQYEPLQAQTPDSFRRVFAGKLRGGWLLHQTCGPDVRSLVLFSSASTVLSSPFVGAYAAANAFLDALAHARPCAAARVLSVNWGPWAEVGMVARHDRGTRTGGGEVGRTIRPEQGIQALELALSSGLRQVAVLPIDWHEWRRQYGHAGIDPLLSRLIEPTRSDSEARDASPPAVGHSPSDCTHLEATLREQFERVMDLRAGELVEDKPLVSMGLDSLMAVELRGAIETCAGVTIPLLRFIEGATARDIIADVLAASDRGAAPSPAATTRDMVAMEEGEI
jgi:NAD(P)-dependent dehydrogenase (short-subunit alcohol dehydrogenase family)/acyl carrier protein